MERYFVYELVDPRDGSIFYVGKGSKDRPDQHVRQALKGKRSRKCDRIREILAAERAVQHNIVRRFADEAEAYAYEIERIAELGLANLTNVLPGGWGSYSKPLPEPMWPASMAETIARSLRVWAAHGKIVVMGNFDVTEGFRSVMKRVFDEWGEELFIARLAKHGVRINIT